MTDVVPGTVLLVGADSQLASLICAELKLAGEVRLMEAASQDDLLSRVGMGGVEALCVGPGWPDPLSLVQHVHREDRDLTAIILAEPDQRGELDRLRLFTPFLGPDVTCRSIEEAAMLGAELSDAAARTRERRRHQATIEVVSQHADSSTAPRPLAARHFAPKLDRAPIGVVTLDADGNIRGWNRRAQDLLDRQERSIGTPLRELFAPADQERLAEHLKTGTLTDEPQNADVFELLISDRTSRWVEVSSAVDEEGAGDEVIVLLQDVTRRVVAERRHRALEQELQSSRRLLEAVVGGTADAAFVKDRNGRYLLINNAGAAAMGVHAEEVVGRTDADLLPVDVAARIRQDDLAVMQTA
ncbi:MAG: PAS domain-containing protein [Actinomycetota bacterium]|nr:PAS domain-containing protein [Actinomycetota bacterium]